VPLLSRVSWLLLPTASSYRLRQRWSPSARAWRWSQAYPQWCHDLARTRIALGIVRLAYAAVIVLLICAGGLFGFTAVGGDLAITESSPPVPLVIDAIAAGCAMASFGTFFSMPWRLLAFPIAVGMLAHAARRALISTAKGSAPAGALVACLLVSVVVTPVADRLHLPFAAVACSAVLSLMPGFFLFNAATGLVELVSIGPSAPAALRERRHSVSDHLGHDLRADPSAHAARAHTASASIESGMDVLCTAPPFKTSPKPG
jgi:uncharacterized membrane protein YjjB (DUF3815 family)